MIYKEDFHAHAAFAGCDGYELCIFRVLEDCVEVPAAAAASRDTCPPSTSISAAADTRFVPVWARYMRTLGKDMNRAGQRTSCLVTERMDSRGDIFGCSY